MNPSRWPEWMEDTLWAKSAAKGESGEPESLARHTWLVLSRLTDFIRLRPALPTQLDIPRLWHILYWAAFLHDFGKAAQGFQSRLRGGPRWEHRHEVLSLVFIEWLAEGFQPDERNWLAAAIVSHHRDATEIRDRYPLVDEFHDEILTELVAEMDKESLNALWQWLTECSNAWIDDLALSDLGVKPLTFVDRAQALEIVQKNGMERLKFWLKSYRKFVQQLERIDDMSWTIGTIALRGHIINADHSASAHAPALPKLKCTKRQILDSRNIQEESLFFHQRESGKTTGSVLLVAPTGSGKTEAALLWAAKQMETDNKPPRIFYTLPYQASMNAMKVRLAETFEDRNVGLQHGRGLLALYRLLLERENTPASAAREARWARNLAQLNYPPVRIFSPYQMLKGMYRLKGYEALLTDYHNGLFIFDEIHAYETKRLALILKSMQFLRRHFNAQFFVMSATFPSLIRGWLNDALDQPTLIQADIQLFNKLKRHRLFLLEGELTAESGMQRIVRDVEIGKSVLVVCNRVDRAQAVYDELQERLSGMAVEIELLHGRFNMRDRSFKEQLIRDATGSKSGNRRRLVLVSTQAVEVSLDIDIDTIYTDPAPLEALVQRFGRINRRGKQADFAPVHVFSEPSDGQKIYDERLVTRTLAILKRENGRPIDESKIGDWLDEIYAGEIALQWQEEFSAEAQNFEASCLIPLRAFDSNPELEELFYKAFDSVEVLPETLYEEYQKLREDEPILAGELLVPIRWGQYHRLANAGMLRAQAKGEPRLVKAEYTSLRGLELG